MKWIRFSRDFCLQSIIAMHTCILVSELVSNAFGNTIEGSLNSKLPTIWRVEKQMK